MNVSVVVPWRSGCAHRERSWRFVKSAYNVIHPHWEVIEGECRDGPFNRSEAIINGARKASGDIILVADSDVLCDVEAAVQAADTSGWAIPHKLLHRLSEESTKQFYRGVDWRTLELDQSNNQDAKPYFAYPTGTLVAVRKDVLLDVPPDVRFVGWGQEDEAWGLSLRKLVGEPWHGSSEAVHLWHPSQPRLSRYMGSKASIDLLNRYKNCWNNGELRTLIEEGRQLWN